MKKTTKLRDMTVEELIQQEKDHRKELFNLRFQKVTGDLENPMRIRQVKQGIARVKTIAGEKLRAENKQN